MSRLPHPPQGSPEPLGATWDGRGTNFAVFSADAEKVELCLFDSADDEIERSRVEMADGVGGVWHAYLPGVEPGQLYGYRAWGPWDPLSGRRFNPHKLLLDPYARSVGRPLRWHDSVFGFPAKDGLPEREVDTERRDDRDSAAYAPLGAVVDGVFDWGDDAPPRTPWRDSFVYELHVKGFTQLHSVVPEALRGTYLGLASEPSIEHLLSLGVTAVELLPVHHHVSEYRLAKLGLTNYWGYNTLAFFAPEPRYAMDRSPEGVLREFKGMVKALHAAGIEVLLDVVYNHTCEGNERGPTLSLRGFGNDRYYRLQKDRRRHVNYTGTGNTLDTRDPAALRLVTDSLRYWVEEMHVDGFRFDLCSALGRESDRFDPGSGFFDAIGQDPVLRRVKLIAEPWDVDPDGYAVGRCPAGWAEWNGRYRDEVRLFWKGDAWRTPPLATRLSGSSDFYNRNNRAPWASVNFLCSHDGFTLADLVSYERKHNMANGEHNRDGDNHNNSRNHGHEGPTQDPDIVALRDRQRRNLLATLLLSAGTPMLAAGDEFGRTQRGNNNAYCQDNEVSWLDWEWTTADREILDFVRLVSGLRREQSALRRDRFFRGARAPGLDFKDIAWYTPEGHEMLGDDWRDGERRALGALVGPDNGGDPLLFLLNASARTLDFLLPPALAGAHWQTIFDTAQPYGGAACSLRAVRTIVRESSFVAMRMVPDEE